MRNSRLPKGGQNLFQSIKAKRAEAEAGGIKIINLSIGQPAGPAIVGARKAAAGAVLCDKESMHEYQDNGSPGVPDFAKRFVAGHAKRNCLNCMEGVDFLPIPGIKPMLGLIILACGSDSGVIATTTKPGYPTPKDWCGYLKMAVDEPDMNPENSFLFNPEELHKDVGLIMMNYPHNPSGAVANKDWLESLCYYCVKNDIRIFNDAAYAALSYGSDSCLLTEVASHFPNLSWAEAFSASKLIGNGTGWRVGAMIGSPDFIGDIKTIKGNTDSGFVAPMAYGALIALESCQDDIKKIAELYKHRAEMLCNILTGAGMQIALEPKAGFFTLWKTPKQAFGKKIESAKDFNFAMIENTGVVGVHFDPYIRYAVASANVEAIAKDIKAAFEKAQVSY